MKTPIFLVFLSLTTALFAADDIRSKVSDERDEEDAASLIDPDKSIFGIPLGTSEDEVVRKKGKPAGYLNLKGDDTAMLYGNHCAFLFERGKLAGVLVTYSTVDHELAQRMAGTNSFEEKIAWKLSNGVESDMTLADVRQVLGDSLSSENAQFLHRQHFLTDKSRVELSFSRRSDKPKDDEDSYRLMGVLITPKSSSRD